MAWEEVHFRGEKTQKCKNREYSQLTSILTRRLIGLSGSTFELAWHLTYAPMSSRLGAFINNSDKVDLAAVLELLLEHKWWPEADSPGSVRWCFRCCCCWCKWSLWDELLCGGHAGKSIVVGCILDWLFDSLLIDRFDFAALSGW